MANDCIFEMSIYGKEKDADEFFEILNNDYDKRHMFRIFSAYLYEKEVIDGIAHLTVAGSCAWNCLICMTEGDGSYFLSSDDPNKTSLFIETKRLHLAVELYSEEPGMQFQEHFIFIDGKAVCEDCIDYEEWYIEDESTLESHNESHPEHILTMDEVENLDEPIFKYGGYESWDFTDYTSVIKNGFKDRIFGLSVSPDSIKNR